MTSVPCPKCSQIIDLSDKPIQHDDSVFYTCDAVCDSCGVSVQACLEVCNIVVIDDRSVVSQL